MNKEDKFKLFEAELASVTDEKLRNFAEELLNDTDDWFYHEPASTSGKYHPDFSLGDGGLMRHTRAVVYFINEFARAKMFDMTERDFDLLRVAAIAHDIRKHDENGRYIKEHAGKAGEFIREEYIKHSKLLSQKEVDFICHAVESHMGIWGTPAPKSRAEWALHMADLCASRKEINMTFPDYVPVERSAVMERKEPKVLDAKTYVFDFGKCKGKTLNEVYAEGDYLQWIARQEDFGHKDEQNMIIEYLNGKNK